MVEWLPRSAWTDTKPGFSKLLTISRVKGEVFHYPGDSAERLNASKETVAALLRGYRRYHVGTRGWADIGYCHAIDQSGRIWECAGDRVAAHSASAAYPTANWDWLGCLLVIGSNESPSPAMIEAIKEFGRVKRAKFPNMAQISGHRLIPGAQTDCPGNKVIALIKAGAFNPETPVVTPTPTPTPTPVPPKPAGKNSYAKRPYSAGSVSVIQGWLANAGYYTGGIDDDYGPLTYAAVKDYQASQLFGGLVADGDWGPHTEAHFKWVGILQTALNNWKSSYPDLRVDGDYRDLTKRRVYDWQKRNHGGSYPRGAALDGLAGPVTCRGLSVPAHP